MFNDPICLSKPAFNIYICFFDDSINYTPFLLSTVA